MSAKRPAYVIAEVEVTDPAVFQEYVAQAIPTLQQYNARIVVRAKPDTKEGARAVGDIVIAVFESMEDAQSWYHAAEYTAAIPVRQRAANTRLMIVEGEPV